MKVSESSYVFVEYVSFKVIGIGFYPVKQGGSEFSVYAYPGVQEILSHYGGSRAYSGAYVGKRDFGSFPSGVMIDDDVEVVFPFKEVGLGIYERKFIEIVRSDLIDVMKFFPQFLYQHAVLQSQNVPRISDFAFDLHFLN